MRWLIRMLLFWAITGPLFYFFGLPYLLTMLQNKTRAETYASCTKQVAALNMSAQAETYCHCLSDDLTFTKDDLYDAMQKKPPAHITGQVKQATESCSTILQPRRAPTANAPLQTIPGHIRADGKEVINF